MEEYAARTRSDGLPADPLLRTHVRAVYVEPNVWVVHRC
jgi:hypothetical protein